MPLTDLLFSFVTFKLFQAWNHCFKQGPIHWSEASRWQKCLEPWARDFYQGPLWTSEDLLLSITADRIEPIISILPGNLQSVQFSLSVVSDSLWPHESQHARPPCPSLTPRVHSNSHPLSRWCHPAISSSVVLFSSCPQSLPASESFPMSQLSAWGGQSTGVSALASFLPKKSKGWSPSEWTGWISL